MIQTTCYVCRREWRSRLTGRKGKVTYQVWLICQLRVVVVEASAAVSPELSVGHALSADSAKELGEHLKDALAQVTGDRVGEMIWRSADDLSEDQVAALIVGLPDTIKTLAAKLLEAPADAAGVPPVAASLGADVTATLLLKPVLEPIESAVHALEVVGIAIGMLTGLHGLAIFCIKHLAHDKLGNVLTSAFKQVIDQVNICTVDDQPSAASSAAAGSTPSPPVLAAITSPPSSSGSAVVSREIAASPQSPSLPTVTATGSGETTNRVIPVEPSSETARKLRAVEELFSMSTTDRQESTRSPRDILLSTMAKDDQPADLPAATSDLSALD